MGSTEREPAQPAADRNEADRAAEALWRELERRCGLTIRAVRPDLDVEAQARGLLRPGSTRERAS